MDLSILPAPSGNYYTGNQLFDSVKTEAHAMFAAAEARKRAISSVDEITRYQREKRALFIEAIGGLPEERSPLNAAVTGILRRDGYRIEKVVFESQPDFHVPGLLYVPDRLRGEKNAAVLFLCGHWGFSKAVHEYQKVCQELARAGFVVLAIDPVGQGERQQYFVPDGGYGRLSSGVPEHAQMGLQCVLAGSNLARYYVGDMIRAVDYLASLPYVDPTRIGVTGNSGGGTQTSYLMIADDRIAAAVPCTYLNDRELYLASGQSHDAEQNIFGAISNGLGYDDFLISFAPKPALVGAVRFDFFHFKGTARCVESARRIYRLFGKENNCQLAVADTSHMYAPALRKAAANFFIEHLCDLPPTHPGCADEELHIEPPENLACFTTRNVRAEFPRERTVFQLNSEYLRRHARRQTPTAGGVAQVLCIADKLPRRSDSTYRIEASTAGDADLYEWNGMIRKRVDFFSEDDIFLTGMYFQERRTEGKRPPLWLVVPEEGLSDGPKIHSRLKLLWSGNAVFVTDTRGVGAGESHPIGPGPRLGTYGTDSTIADDLLMMGRSLLGLRVYDVLRAVDCLAEMGGDVNTDRISIHGYGLGAIYSLFAAVLEPRIAGGVLEEMLPAFQEIVDTELFLLPCPARLAVHGILRHFDIPDVLKALEPKRFEVRNPISPGG